MLRHQINGQVAKVFQQYPDPIKEKLLILRALILETGDGLEEVDEIEETLKWGEPSYLTKNGSTIRLGWHLKDPNHYGIYFNCQSRLVETFKELFVNEFKFQGNRAILFDEEDLIPEASLKLCIELALTYHLRKKLPMLGA